MTVLFACFAATLTACAPEPGSGRDHREASIATCDHAAAFDGDHVLLDGTQAVTVDGEAREGFVLALGFEGSALTVLACRATGWFQERLAVRFVQGEDVPTLEGFAWNDELAGDVRTPALDGVVVDRYDIVSSDGGGELDLALSAEGVEVDWAGAWGEAETVEEDPFADW